MNFFEHQAQARGKTRRLVLLFVLAVAAMVAAIVSVATLLLSLGLEQPAAQVMSQHAGALLLVALATLVVIGLASLYKTASLRSGGSSVVRALGGTLVPADTADNRLRRLRNVVEEIAIASAIPVPEIYVLEQEPGINAFAAGWSPADAALAVTRGTLEKLNRDELQGVIAHEFSHVLNGDMRLNIRLMGLLFGILVIALIGREVFRATSRSRGSSRKSGGGAVVVAALAVMLIGYIGLFFGRLIKAGVSRSREFLADSSAVQFTRQTAGIAGALKKIAGIDGGSRLQDHGGEEVSHMLFGDGVGYSALFATHPPLLDRIRRMEPQFRPEQLGAHRQQWNAPGYVADAPTTTAPLAARISSASAVLSAESVMAHMARPSDQDHRHAKALHAAMAPPLLAAAADAEQAWPLLLALLLDPEAGIRERQLAAIAGRFGRGHGEAVSQQFAQLAGLPPEQRLPLAALAFPCLRHRPRQQLEQFMLVVSELIQADGDVAMFEFCLGSLLRTQAADVLHPARARMIGAQRLGHCREAALTLLAVLARQGHSEPDRARQAFVAGATHLFAQAAERYAPPARPVAALVPALRMLDQLDGPGKQLLIEAMVKTLAHDQRVTVGEVELLRAVCGGLHCPLPPLLQG